MLQRIKRIKVLLQKDWKDQNVASKDREDQSDAAKDQNNSKDLEDLRLAMKDRKIKVLLQKDQVIVCYRRWRHWRVIVPVTNECWKLPMMYRCITLIPFNMLSLLSPIVDDFFVSRIPFLLSGCVEIL